MLFIVEGAGRAGRVGYPEPNSFIIFEVGWEGVRTGSLVLKEGKITRSNWQSGWEICSASVERSSLALQTFLMNQRGIKAGYVKSIAAFKVTATLAKWN